MTNLQGLRISQLTHVLAQLNERLQVCANE
jgi:hypothetical protein